MSDDLVLYLEKLRIETIGGVVLVDDVDVSLKRGEILGLIGESGAGKSTIGLGAMAYARAGCRITGGGTGRGRLERVDGLHSASPWWFGSMLSLGEPDDETIQSVRQRDLAGKARVAAQFIDRIEHVLFDRGALPDALGPIRINIDMAGSAGAIEKQPGESGSSQHYFGALSEFVEE